MSRTTNEDAQMAHSHPAAGEEARVSESPAELVQRWRDLREMLIQQLDMFENRGLTLHSNQADISSSAVADLKNRILAFDALISGDAGSADET